MVTIRYWEHQERNIQTEKEKSHKHVELEILSLHL